MKDKLRTSGGVNHLDYRTSAKADSKRVIEMKWHPPATHVRRFKGDAGEQPVEVTVNGHRVGLVFDQQNARLWIVAESPEFMEKNRNALMDIAAQAAHSGGVRGEFFSALDGGVKLLPPTRELYLDAISMCAERALEAGATLADVRHAVYAAMGLE